MSGFVAGGTNEAFTLTNDGFWPDIDADALRAAQRIESAVTNPRLEVAIVAAMTDINRELFKYKLACQAEGYERLADVPSDQINNQSILLSTYVRAVYSATSAEVMERYRTYDATNSGNTQAEAEATSADEYRRDQRWAIRDLLGVSRTTVELL